MKLPFFQTKDQDLSLMQSRWKGILDPVLSNPSIQSIILERVSLGVGETSIDHKLGRKPIGWRVIRLRAPAFIFDVQDFNQRPDLTLDLNSDAVTVVDLEIF